MEPLERAIFNHWAPPYWVFFFFLVTENHCLKGCTISGAVLPMTENGCS